MAKSYRKKDSVWHENRQGSSIARLYLRGMPMRQFVQWMPRAMLWEAVSFGHSDAGAYGQRAAWTYCRRARFGSLLDAVAWCWGTLRVDQAHGSLMDYTKPAAYRLHTPRKREHKDELSVTAYGPDGRLIAYAGDVRPQVWADEPAEPEPVVIYDEGDPALKEKTVNNLAFYSGNTLATSVVVGLAPNAIWQVAGTVAAGGGGALGGAGLAVQGTPGLAMLIEAERREMEAYRAARQNLTAAEIMARAAEAEARQAAADAMRRQAQAMQQAPHFMRTVRLTRADLVARTLPVHPQEIIAAVQQMQGDEPEANPVDPV